MIKLKRYFFKFWPMILMAVLLLFCQANAELSLPDYMSDIVSGGIQSGGIDSPVGDIYSEETFSHLKLFMSEKDVNTLENDYEYVKNADISKSIKETYPKINKQNIYVLKDDLSSKQKSKLENILLKPTLMISSIGSMDKNSQQYKEMFAKLPEGVSPFQAIASMPSEAKEQMLKKVDSQIETMGESTLSIAAGTALKNEYNALGRNVDSIQNDYIFNKGLIMLAICLAGTICAIAVAFLSSKIGAGIARCLRKDVFEKVESFSNEEFNHFSTASLITRTTNDITQIQMVCVMLIRIVCFAPIMGIGALYKALTNAPTMTWIIALVLFVIAIVMAIAFTIVLPKFKIIQSLIDRLNLRMRENLSGMLVIRAFGNEEHSEKRFDDANTDLTKVNLFVNRTMACIMPIMLFIFNVVTLIIVYYGSKQVDLGNIDIGSMMAFMQYAMQIIMSFLMIAMISIMLPRASVSANRINEILTTDPKINDPKEPQKFDESKRGVIEFNNVSFKYPGAQEPVLSNIDFIAKPGETTAFIGSTGSGKSTLINLIPRFYEVTSGDIKVDGVDIRNVTQHDLREKVGLVPQKANLFGGTIRSNLTYGNSNASDEELNEVLRISQASEFMEKQEDGLDSRIAQGGDNFSGGQKQRLAIARAIAKNPDILIFDDSFSALDFKTDASLRHELNKMVEKTKSTVLIVGQRIASIMSADQIVVLNEGKIVGKGKHDELMKTCKVYQEIAYSQLSKEELNNG